MKSAMDDKGCLAAAARVSTFAILYDPAILGVAVWITEMIE